MRGWYLGVIGLGLACGPEESGNDEGGDTGNSCDFDMLVDDVAEASEQPPLDCGFATLDDDLATWQAAHDCALAEVANQRAVKLIWQPQAIDSIGYQALLGVVGESYGITRISWDNYQGDITAASFPCDDVTPYPECVVEVGSMCLDCTGGHPPVDACP